MSRGIKHMTWVKLYVTKELRIHKRDVIIYADILSSYTTPCLRSPLFVVSLEELGLDLTRTSSYVIIENHASLFISSFLKQIQSVEDNQLFRSLLQRREKCKWHTAIPLYVISIMNYFCTLPTVL